MKHLFVLFLALGSAAYLGAQTQSGGGQQPANPAGPERGSNETEMTNPMPNTDNELRTLAVELREISEHLREVQLEARQSSQVQDALVEYFDALHDAMVEIAPDQEESIERKNELMNEMVRYEDAGEISEEEQQEAQSMVEEHQMLRQQLAQIEQQAAQEQPVQEKQQAAQEAQMEKMQELEPNLMELARQRAELLQRLQELRQEGAGEGQSGMQGSMQDS